MNKQTGFTLIELVIVIIVLGILAATAVPKFINLQDDAKASAMQGLEAAIHSAANIVYSKAAIAGVETSTAATPVSAAGGTDISTIYGYPTANAVGIEAAVELSGFTTFVSTNYNEVLFVANNGQSEEDQCVVYKQATETTPYKVVIGELGGDAYSGALCGNAENN